MSYQEIYKTNYSRIVRESKIKSIVFGVVIGLGVATVIALATMFVDFNGIWLALGALIAVSVAMSFMFYFVKFRPTEKYVAERFDRMGFDERFITMLELEGDESYIAKMQRENTMAAITAAAERNNGEIAVRTTTEKLSAVGLTTRNIIISAVVFVVAVISLSFTALPNKRIKDIFGITPEYNIGFSSGVDGYITSSANDYKLDTESLTSFSQTVREGDASATVVVTARNGFVFAGWSDSEPNGTVDPSRNVGEAYAALNVFAKYEGMEEPEDLGFEGGNGTGPTGPGDPANDNSNAPPGDPSDEQGEGGELGPPSSGATAGNSSQNGQILDGDTDYREVFGEYYEEVMRMLSEGKELPPRLRQLYESYFKGLA